MLQKVKDFFGVNKGLSGLLVMVVLVGLGEKMAERFLPLYLTALGASLLMPGVLNGMDNFLSAIYSIPGGWFTAKYGYKRSLLWFNILAMFGYAIVILFPQWIAVIVGSFFFLSWTSLSLPASMELVRGEVPKNKQVMGVSLHSLVRRIPMAIGPVVGGLLIDSYGIKDGIRYSFVIAFLLGVLSTLVQQFTLKDDVPHGAHLQPFVSLFRFPRNLKILLVSDILIRFCEQIPYAYIAIWAVATVGGAGVSASEFGVLTAIEMVVALLIYIPVAYFADKANKKPFVVATFIFFMLFPLILWLSTSFVALVFAFIFRGLKEFGEPTRKSLIMDLAPIDGKPIFFGSYYFYRDVAVTLGALIGAYLWQYSTPAVTFLSATLFGVFGVLVFGVWGRDETFT